MFINLKYKALIINAFILWLFKKSRIRLINCLNLYLMAKKVNKSFWIDKDVARKFKSKCAELECRNSEIVEILMVKWLNKNNGKE